MLLRRVALTNVRSFLDRQELVLDGPISILIGPNGGGKTNLLDATVIMLRRYLFASRYPYHAPTPEEPYRWEIRHNDALNQLVLEKHSQALDQPQVVEVVVEVTKVDVENMAAIKHDAGEIETLSKRQFYQRPWDVVQNWVPEDLSPGTLFSYVLIDGVLQSAEEAGATQFLQYLQLFEFDNTMRAEVGKASLQMPMVYLPVNRASGGFQSNVALAGYNDIDQKRTWDATSSRTGSNIIQLSIGRLAKRYRRLLEDNNQSAPEVFYASEDLKALAADLADLGYEWKLETIDPDTNSYDAKLSKQGSAFLVGAASSGERELLTYLFAVYALRVRDALIVVDEPELHLHPRWQKALLGLFEKLSKETGNQFVLATHSPTFVSPASIQYVSRVYSRNQRSHILRMDAANLPDAKHLFNVVNSQNNERVFFTDKVVLVEGISDRIYFERVLEILTRQVGMNDNGSLEMVSVGGKGLFPAYKKLLDACGVESVIIADLDYIEEVGTGEVKRLFVLDAEGIKRKVVDDATSRDGEALVANIEKAITDGNWEHALQTWEYIKSRRRRLKPALSDAEQKILEAFLTSKAAEGVFILSRGALEAYLPEGYLAKDIEKLIAFVNSDTFWGDVPMSGKAEIERIVGALLPAPVAPNAEDVVAAGS